MKNKYIEGVSPSKLDAKISEIATEVESEEFGGGAMVVAIQNEEGEIYRVITTYGLSSYLGLVQPIAELGLTDIYADEMNPQKYDSLFVF